MDSIVTIKLLLFLFFIVMSAFFSSAETAFTAISRVKLRSLVEERVKGSRRLEKILNNKHDLITAILIGNNIANVAASALATAGIMDILMYLGIKNFAAALAIVTGIMTFILLTFGEITPKSVAIKNPSRFALRMRTPIYFFLIISKPVILVFNFISGIITKLLGINTFEVAKMLTHSEIKAIINLGEEEGLLEKEEKEMINGVITFRDKIVREIVTPPADVISVEMNTEISRAIELIRQKGHSRIPVYEGSPDNIVGMIYAKDLLMVDFSDTSLKLKKFMRSPTFIPETVPIEEVLKQMRDKKFHIAIVIDEYGGFAGVVTFEDIIEEIIGDVQDEYDTEDVAFMQLNETTVRVAASMNINDLSQKLDTHFPDEDYDTVGGFVMTTLGTVPKIGDTFSYKNLTFIVRNVQKKRILTVDVVKEA